MSQLVDGAAFYKGGPSLYGRMREAATILEDASLRQVADQHYPRGASVGEISWNAVGLHHWADKWEAEDKAKREQEGLADRIACNLFKSSPMWNGESWDLAHSHSREVYINAAERLLRVFDMKPKDG